jgi:hypothetical protein
VIRGESKYFQREFWGIAKSIHAPEFSLFYFRSSRRQTAVFDRLKLGAC